MSAPGSASASSSSHPLVDDLFQKIIGPFAATHISPLLEEPEHIEDRIQLLTQTFSENPSLLPPFQAFVKSLQRAEVEVSLEEQIRFYTTKGTRDWLIINLMNDILDIKELRIEKESGRLPGKPAELIKFATTARTAVGEESRYKDFAFAVGLMFDFVFHLQKTSYLGLGQTKFDEPINQAFAKALEQIKVLLVLGKHKSKLSLERLLPCTALLRQLAQVCLYVLKPGAGVEFYKKLSTLKFNESMKLAMEKETFGIHTGHIAAFLGQSLQILDPLGEAMSVWGAPYLTFYSQRRDIHDLAALGQLGVCISEYGLKGPAFGTDGRPSFALPELKNLDFVLTPGVKSEIKI